MKRIISLSALSFLFFRKLTPTLVPVSGLKKIKNNEWMATDNDPQFILKSFLLKFLSGRVKISVKIDSAINMTPKLYLDFGEGFSESRTVYFQQTGNNTYHADLMIPHSPKKVRFDPNENPGTFTTIDFKIKVYSSILYTIYQYIIIAKNDYKSKTDTLRIFKKSYKRYKKHGLNGMLERLEKEYQKLHPNNVKRHQSKYTSYANWINQNETKNNEEFNKDDFQNTPIISVIMATYNTPIEYLKKAIDSVMNQSYPHWELCIADDASTDMDVIEILKDYMKKDDRINVFFRKNNGNISIASNSALVLANGEYVALMDHDDMLSFNALLEIVKVINISPDVKLIYSDEDKIDELDKRYDPHFKSDWNQDMFLSQNYISHLSVIKKSLFDEIGTFRTGYEGAQDYDLLLRITGLISSNEIVHIPKVLYHWRAFEGSTAYDPKAKEYTTEAGVNALKNYFFNQNNTAEVEVGMVPNTYKISYPLKKEPFVSLIIPTRDSYDILSLCIESIIEKTIYENYEIIIVDNQTTDPKTLTYFDDLIKVHQHIRIIKYNKEFNYSAINNFAVAYARGELIGLINNDVEVISNHWLTEMVQHAIRPDIGAVGAMLYYNNNTIQHAGVILGLGGVAGHSHKHFKRGDPGYFHRLKIVQNLSAVTAACLIVKKELYLEVGGLDEENLKVAFNDVNICIKIQQLGYRNLWTPYAELYHHESVSRGADDNEEKKARFEKEIFFMKDQWKNQLKEDRYYNRNLTKDYENFGINIG